MEMAKKVDGFSVALCPKYRVKGVRKGQSPLATHAIWWVAVVYCGYVCLSC